MAPFGKMPLEPWHPRKGIKQHINEIGNGRDGTKQAKMPYFHCGFLS